MALSKDSDKPDNVLIEDPFEPLVEPVARVPTLFYSTTRPAVNRNSGFIEPSLYVLIVKFSILLNIEPGKQQNNYYQYLTSNVILVEMGLITGESLIKEPQGVRLIVI